MNNPHEGQSKVMFWINNDDLKSLDVALKKLRYQSRAEWMRENIRETIKKSKNNV